MCLYKCYMSIYTYIYHIFLFCKFSNFMKIYKNSIIEAIFYLDSSIAIFLFRGVCMYIIYNICNNI